MAGSDTDSAHDDLHEGHLATDAHGDSDAMDAAVKRGAATTALPARTGVDDVLRARRKFTHTTEAQRRSIIEWLEQPPNFQLLARRAPPVLSDTGKKLKKADGFRSLMRHVNAATQCEWDLETTRSRYESLLHAFRKTKQAAEHPDFAISPNDRARGITDVRQKRNAMCLFYDRLDALTTAGAALGAAAKSKRGDHEAPSPHDTSRAATAATAASPASAKADNSALRPSSRPVTIAPKGTVAISRTPAPLPTKEMEDANWRRLAALNVAIAPAPASATATTGGLQSAVGALSLESTESTTSGSSGAGTPPPSTLKLPAAKRIKHRHVAAASTEESSEKHCVPSQDAASAAAPAMDTATHASTPIGTSEHIRLKELEVESQRLALQQQQLQLQTRELDLKEKELAAQEAMKKQALRADLTTKLIAAGTSLSEIKEYLALLDG